jgi:hypothetical protein
MAKILLILGTVVFFVGGYALLGYIKNVLNRMKEEEND